MAVDILVGFSLFLFAGVWYKRTNQLIESRILKDW